MSPRLEEVRQWLQGQEVDGLPTWGKKQPSELELETKSDYSDPVSNRATSILAARGVSIKWDGLPAADKLMTARAIVRLFGYGPDARLIKDEILSRSGSLRTPVKKGVHRQLIFIQDNGKTLMASANKREKIKKLPVFKKRRWIAVFDVRGSMVWSYERFCKKNKTFHGFLDGISFGADVKTVPHEIDPGEYGTIVQELDPGAIFFLEGIDGAIAIDHCDIGKDVPSLPRGKLALELSSSSACIGFSPEMKFIDRISKIWKRFKSFRGGPIDHAKMIRETTIDEAYLARTNNFIPVELFKITGLNLVSIDIIKNQFGAVEDQYKFKFIFWKFEPQDLSSLAERSRFPPWLLELLEIKKIIKRKTEKVTFTGTKWHQLSFLSKGNITIKTLSGRVFSNEAHTDFEYAFATGEIRRLPGSKIPELVPVKVSYDI